MKRAIVSASIALAGSILFGQLTAVNLSGSSLNAIETSVPFLTIAPDAVSAGMGDVGAASSPDVYSQHWNAAKYAFAENRGGVAFTNTPWLRNLVPDINLYYLSGYYNVNDRSGVSSSFRYFNLGDLLLFSATSGWTLFIPTEFALDAGYIRKLTNDLSGSMTFRYIRSDPVRGLSVARAQGDHLGESIAGDLGLYLNKEILTRTRVIEWAAGLNISNIGTRVSYSASVAGTRIPTNMRIGTRFSTRIQEIHAVSVAMDLNKLLVPTPGVYASDSITGALVLIRGKEDPESILLGMLQSFYDAPGMIGPDGRYSTIREEFAEVALGIGLEYAYRQNLSLRSGYFHENAAKGNRNYVTMGIGFQLFLIHLDFSFLKPTSGANSPLDHTYRLGLSYNFHSR